MRILFESRLERERRTVEAVVSLYCRGLHGSGHDLCRGCSELLEYAEQRLARCPYCEGKPACTECPIHCYRASSRAQIQAVMRYAGPRMLLRHPILAFFHWIDGRRPATEERPGSRRAAPTSRQAHEGTAADRDVGSGPRGPVKKPCPHCETGSPPA